MCSEARINGEWCDTIDKLLAHLSPIVFRRGYQDCVNDDTCLCPVNMEATAKENGYRVARDDETQDWIFTKEDKHVKSE